MQPCLESDRRAMTEGKFSPRDEEIVEPVCTAHAMARDVLRNANHI
jgi:hypothetical protein